jgi:hypothetical protein
VNPAVNWRSRAAQAARMFTKSGKIETGATPFLRQSCLLDTRVIDCGDNSEPLAKIIIPLTARKFQMRRFWGSWNDKLKVFLQ